MGMRVICAVLALGLAACKGGDGGEAVAGGGSCIGSFLGGNVQNLTSACTMCSYASEPRRAIDGIRETSADWRYGSGSAAGVAARAASGVVFAGGNFAGALMSIPPEYTGTTWTIATYLDGLPQETRTPANASGGDLEAPTGDDDFYGFITTEPFDEVRILLEGGAAGLEPPAFRIYEFCGDR